MPRPRIQIDKEDFEKLCAMQCTQAEMASYFSCSHDTLERWIKNTYGRKFEEVFNEKRGKGLVSLRRSQFRMSENNPTMAIWLGKQYLGQKDVLTFNTFDDSEDDPLTASIKAMVDKE